MSSGTGTLESHNTLPESSIGAQDANLKLITGKGQFGIGDFTGTLTPDLTFQGGIQYDCGCVTSVQNETGANSISVFPNPVTNQFTIYDLRFTIEHVEIYDVRGQKVLSQPQTSNLKPQTVIVSGLSAGIYFAYALLDDNSVKRIKFIKE